jgi:hypothetical protein
MAAKARIQTREEWLAGVMGTLYRMALCAVEHSATIPSTPQKPQRVRTKPRRPRGAK